MYGNMLYGMQDRVLREQDFAERVAERERYALAKHKSSWRARTARRLFELTVAAEREERPGAWSGRGWKRGAGCKAGPLAGELDV